MCEKQAVLRILQVFALAELRKLTFGLPLQKSVFMALSPYRQKVNFKFLPTN